jgi:hypothetical protein
VDGIVFLFSFRSNFQGDEFAVHFAILLGSYDEARAFLNDALATSSERQRNSNKAERRHRR